MDQVRTDFPGVFNRGFRDGWKSALKKAKVLRTSKWFLRERTPLPYPEAGLRDSDTEKEDDDEDDEESEGEEVGGQSDQQIVTSTPPVGEPSANNPPATFGSVPVEPDVCVPSAPSNPALIGPDVRDAAASSETAPVGPKVVILLFLRKQLRLIQLLLRLISFLGCLFWFTNFDKVVCLNLKVYNS